MEGEAWVDRLMHPLVALRLRTSDYNAIYEAVMRGSEQQGERLVAAILAVRGK